MPDSRLVPILSSDLFFMPPDFSLPESERKCLPFLFWLTQAVQPRHVLAFGSGTLDAYMGVCQSVQTSALPTRAVITADFGALGVALKAVHDRRYRDFSTFVQSDAVQDSLDVTGADMVLIQSQDSADLVQALADRPDPAAALTLLAFGPLDSLNGDSAGLGALAQAHLLFPDHGVAVYFLGDLPAGLGPVIDMLQPDTEAFAVLCTVMAGLARPMRPALPGPEPTGSSDALALYRQENLLLVKALQDAFAERDMLRKASAATRHGRELQDHLDSLNRQIDTLTHDLAQARQALAAAAPGTKKGPRKPAAPDRTDTDNPFANGSGAIHDLTVARKDVQIALARWQSDWLARQGGLMRRKIGPSGGAWSAELAKVTQSPLFDAAWYLKSYPDVAKAKLSAQEHFLRHGLFEGRNPGPNFNTLGWFMDHPDALAARRNPLLDGA